jgi:small subunit ribosomal protein S2
MRTRERDKLERALGGIKDMGGLPDIIIVIDTNKESLAIKEAEKLGIPVVAVLDSNCDPRGITFPIPGNDDAMRSISLYCSLFSDAVLDGLQQEAITSGADLGEALDASEVVPTGFEGTEGSEEAHAEVKEAGQEQSADS